LSFLTPERPDPLTAWVGYFPCKASDHPKFPHPEPCLLLLPSGALLDMAARGALGLEAVEGMVVLHIYIYIYIYIIT
jgi:hypothetical protein